MIEIMRKYQKRYPKDDESMKKAAVTKTISIKCCPFKHHVILDYRNSFMNLPIYLFYMKYKRI